MLEVNLSPSLATDAPLDMKIKSNVIADFFNLMGIEAVNPTETKKVWSIEAFGKIKKKT